MFGVLTGISFSFPTFLEWCLIAMCIIFFFHSLYFIVLMYISMFTLALYKWYCLFFNISLPLEEKWTVPRKIVCYMWHFVGRIWHGYEIKGLENLPEGGALIIFYHGAWPVDYCYFASKIFLLHKRMCHVATARLLFNIPGFSLFSESLNITTGTVESCSARLSEGNLFVIAPGGIYEGQFSHNYEVMFQNRLGFAKAAITAKVPIIPMFTENIRDAFQSMSIGRNIFLWLYWRLKMPLVPTYGGLPVKLVIHLGKPIPYDPSNTPEILQRKVIYAIEELIRKYQRQPAGKYLDSLMDRIPQVRNNRKMS